MKGELGEFCIACEKPLSDCAGHTVAELLAAGGCEQVMRRFPNIMRRLAQGPDSPVTK